MAVEPPFDILEASDGQILEFRVRDVDVGPMVINPRDGRPAREVQAIRMFVDPADKRTPPAYWDLTSQLVLPTLLALLVGPGKLPRRIRLTKHGVGAAGRWAVTDLGQS